MTKEYLSNIKLVYKVLIEIDKTLRDGDYTMADKVELDPQFIALLLRAYKDLITMSHMDLFHEF
jgi:hypothetical protein